MGTDAALFVFTAGRADTVEYVVGYLSQLLLGAVVGLIIGMVVFPPLALHEVERATRAVRRDIIRALGALVQLIDAYDASADERAAGVIRRSHRCRTRDSGSGGRRRKRNGRNRETPRRSRWRGSHDDVLSLAGASESASSVVEDLAREMLEERTPLRKSDSSRLSAATAALRDVIDQSREGVPDPDLVRRTHDLLDGAVPDEAPFVVSRATGALRRCLRIATGWTE